MQDLSWQYFKNTGSIEAYLLYKEFQGISADSYNVSETEEATLENKNKLQN